MARWPIFNTTIVRTLNYSDQLKQIEYKFILLESNIDKRFDDMKRSEKPQGENSEQEGYRNINTVDAERERCQGQFIYISSG